MKSIDNKEYEKLSEKIKKQYDSDVNDLKKEIISAKAKAYKELEK